jgi:hypothetical protein
MEVTVNAFMISKNSAELSEMCTRLRDLGYSQSKQIRMYGQDFVVSSNPFPEGDGIAVRAVSKRETTERILQIPLPVLQTLRKKAAA